VLTSAGAGSSDCLLGWLISRAGGPGISVAADCRAIVGRGFRSGGCRIAVGAVLRHLAGQARAASLDPVEAFALRSDAQGAPRWSHTGGARSISDRDLDRHRVTGA